MTCHITSLEKIEDELKYTVILPVDVIQQYGTGWWYVGVRQLVNETDEAYYQDYDDLGLYYDNDLETTMVTFNYSIGFMTAGCYFWETVDELWTTTGCQVSALSSSYFTRCHCNHLTSFGADFFVPPNSIQFETVFANMGDELNDNYAVLATLVGIFLLYFIGLVWARHQDKRDVKKWGVLPLTDNITTDSYFYEITVCTGMRHAAGTRSKIYFILAGDHGDTGIRQLKDDKDVKQFSRGSINKFILSVEQPLGPLSYLRIWHDSSGIGKSQGWYLSKIIVQDLQQEQISVFLCNQWLALEEDDGMTDRLLPVANREDLTRFSNLFLSNTRKNLTDSHLWISIFSRPNWSNFSRVQRLSCLFALIMTSMLSSAMFYKADAKIERAQGYTIGPLKFTLQELYISIVSNLIVLPVSLVIVQLFRRSKPKKTVKENAFNIERPMSALSRIGLTFSHLLRKRTIVTPIASEDGSVHGRRGSTDTLRRHNDQTQPVSPERITAADKGQQTTTSSDQSSIPSVVTPVSFKFAETPAPAVFAGTSSEPPSPGYYDARHHHSPAPPLCLKVNDAVHKTVKYADKLVEYDETDDRRERQQNANEPLFKRINRSSLKSPKVNKPQLTILANKSKSTEFLARCEASLDLTPNDQNFLSISPNRSPNLTPTISPGYESAKSPSGISAFSFDSSHSRHSSVSLTQEEMEDITIPRHANHTAAAKGKITLPHWCVYIAWFLVFLSASVSAFLTFMYSMEWGKQKSLAWLASMILSIVESVSIVQPVKILLLAMFVAAIVRKPEEELEKEEENKVLYQIQPDEICTVHPSGKTSRNTSQMEPPDTVRLKKAREKRLKEMKMFRIIQEIVFYMFYLMILILVASHNRDSKSYQVKQVLMNLLSPKHNLSRINETKHVWDWIDDCLVPGLYPTEHWSNGSSDAEGGRLIVTEAAYRLGPVRLRQHRVKPDLCIRADEVLSYINKCSFDINQDHDSSWDYSVSWKPLSSNNSLLPGYTGPWLYRSSKQTEGLPFVGEIGSYSGGGYVADLIGQKSHVADILVFLRNNNWLDAYTRILFVEFTVYNPNINLFTMSQVVLEMSTTGAILTNVNFFTFRLFTYLGAYGIFMILCELLAFACVIYFIGLELKQIKRDGKGHFRSFWNILQLCTLLTSVVCVMMYLLRHAMTSMAVERITKLRDRFYNFQRIAAWDDVFQTLLAISIFFSILKVIHLLRFNRRMSLLARTLKQAGGEMAAFSLVLFIFLLAFVCCGHLLFGANVHGFSNMIRGFETLMAFSLGSYDFTYLTKSNRTLGPVFFFVYFTFVVFVLVNMFVTILNEAVTVVHYDVARQRNEYELLDFLLGRLKTWLRIDLRKTILDVKKKYMPGLLSCEESIDADMKDIEAKLDRISGKLDFMLTNDHHTVTDFDQLFLDEAHREELGYETSRSNWSTY